MLDRPEPRPPLDAYPIAFRPLQPATPLGNAGGFSGTRLWRFEAATGPYLARAWPVDGPVLDRLRQLHAWQARLAPLQIVPLPCPALSGCTVVARDGRLWQVEPWRPGRAEPHGSTDPARIALAFRTLGLVHERLAAIGDRGPSPGLAARAHELDAWIRGGFDALDARLALAPASDERDLAARWSALARRLAPAVLVASRTAATRVVARQPCLRDARRDHFLFTDDRLTGLVDFGAMDLEHPIADVARLIGDWPVLDPMLRAHALASYAALRPLDADATTLLGPFEQSGTVLAAGQWARWAWLEPRNFEDPGAVALGLRRGLERLDALAGRTLALE